MKINLLLIALAMLLSTTSRADGDYLSVSLATHHWDRQAVEYFDLNERNFGLGFERDVGNFRAFGGLYNNSRSKISAYVASGYLPIRVGEKIRIGIAGGLVTGYFIPVMPMGGLLVTFQQQRIGFNLFATPDMPQRNDLNTHGFVGLQVRYKL